MLSEHVSEGEGAVTEIRWVGVEERERKGEPRTRKRVWDERGGEARERQSRTGGERVECH